MEMKCVFAIDMFDYQWKHYIITEYFHVTYKL